MYRAGEAEGRNQAHEYIRPPRFHEARLLPAGMHVKTQSEEIRLAHWLTMGDTGGGRDGRRTKIGVNKDWGQPLTNDKVAQRLGSKD